MAARGLGGMWGGVHPASSQQTDQRALLELPFQAIPAGDRAATRKPDREWTLQRPAASAWKLDSMRLLRAAQRSHGTPRAACWPFSLPLHAAPTTRPGLVGEDGGRVS